VLIVKRFFFWNFYTYFIYAIYFAKYFSTHFWRNFDIEVNFTESVCAYVCVNMQVCVKHLKHVCPFGRGTDIMP